MGSWDAFKYSSILAAAAAVLHIFYLLYLISFPRSRLGRAPGLYLLAARLVLGPVGLLTEHPAVVDGLAARARLEGGVVHTAPAAAHDALGRGARRRRGGRRLEGPREHGYDGPDGDLGLDPEGVLPILGAQLLHQPLPRLEVAGDAAVVAVDLTVDLLEVLRGQSEGEQPIVGLDIREGGEEGEAGGALCNQHADAASQMREAGRIGHSHIRDVVEHADDLLNGAVH